ncbi:MAG: hypothetical protein EGQ91_06340 [Clostridiales bacterium]|nr:hypothetical protein [Clostridiales bacterium]MBD8979784.1 hypothetical protein [Clostridiales bacterium]
MQTGYAAPYEVSPGVINTQSAQCQSAITWCFLGFEAFIVPLDTNKTKAQGYAVLELLLCMLC